MILFNGCTRLISSLAVVAALAVLPTVAFASEVAKDVNCKKCVDTKDLAKHSVNTSRIKNGTVKPEDLHAGAQPAGAAFTLATGELAVLNSDTTIASISMNLPGPGVVIVNVGGYVRFDAIQSSVRCSINKDTNTLDDFWVVSGNDDSNARRDALASTQGFVEAAAGLQTYNLNCKQLDGTPIMDHVIVTAIFAPQQYPVAPTGSSPQAGQQDSDGASGTDMGVDY